MKRTTTYGHVKPHNGKPATVAVPRGSVDEPMTIRENMLGVAAGAVLRRLLRHH